jgi:PAS domain S-box-containing protein
MEEIKEERTDLISQTINSVFSLLHQHAPDVIWIYSLPKKEFLYISPSVNLLRGFTVDEAMKQDLIASLHPEDYHYIQTHLPARIDLYEKGDEMMKTLVLEVQQPHKNGGMVWVEISTTLVKNYQGKVDQICGISRDITQHKAEIQVLHENKTLFETVFNCTVTGIVLMNEDGRFVNINEGFCRMLGFPK